MEEEIYDWLLRLSFLAAGMTFVFTGRVVAPYGRHTRPGWGPTVSARWGWIVMESPAVWCFAGVFLLGPRAGDPFPLVFAGCWLVHYIHRAFVYPVRRRDDRTRRMPWAIVGMGAAFNLLNGYLNARALSAFGPVYGGSWFFAVRFFYGFAVFWTGFALNRLSDAALRRLRQPGEAGYRIPRGGLFEEVSCPNYLGEVVQWVGWAIMTWTQAGLAFAVFSAANLVPRAISHHRWYQRTFPDYPPRRRAIVPRLL